MVKQRNLGGFRSLRRKLLLAAAAVVTILLTIEWTTRWLYPCAWHGFGFELPHKHFFQHDSRIGWRGRPGARGRFAMADFDTQIELDGQGFRNRTAPVVDGKTNVLVLGDSYAWGWGVEQDEMASSVLMRRNPDLNVYNLSAPGYGTDQQYLVLREFLQSHRPGTFAAAVLLFCAANDVLDVGASERYTLPKPFFQFQGGQLQLSNVPVPDKKGRFFDQQRDNEKAYRTSWWNASHLLNRLYKRPLFLRAFAAMGEKPPATQDFHRARQTTGALLHALRGLASEHRMQFAVVLIRVGFPEEKPVVPFVRRLLSESATPYVMFEVSGRTRLCIDPHPSPYGHRRLATTLEQLLTLGAP
jgi:lysophospholipase L1-like esterase